MLIILTILDHVAAASTAEGTSHTDASQFAPRDAPIAVLSAAKRNAVLACLDGNALVKRNGAWYGSVACKPVSGVTVADLARDGLLTLLTDGRSASARLTKRGNWFAQTLVKNTRSATPSSRD
jgi:hypothetical protein